MKNITTRDLRESLTLLITQKTSDGEGGWREIWNKGPKLWASIWPLSGGNGFEKEDPGGPMASHIGYIKALHPAYYRLIIRAGINMPLKARFLWHLRYETKRLLLATTPILIQCNRFLSMTAVEERNG